MQLFIWFWFRLTYLLYVELWYIYYLELHSKHFSGECGLHILPKLTNQHINSTPYSLINVRLATQMLSSSLSKVLSTCDLTKRPVEPNFVYFICLMTSVKIIDKHRFRQKSSLAQFSSPDDPCVSWLRNIILQYFED